MAVLEGDGVILIRRNRAVLDAAHQGRPKSGGSRDPIDGSQALGRRIEDKAFDGSAQRLRRSGAG